MKRTNPFPGMNPLLEAHWPDVHTVLIGYIRDALAEELPPDLHARAEEEVNVASAGTPERYRADVAVAETWKQELPPVLQSEASSNGVVAVAEPEIIELDHLPARWAEIRDTNGRLITVIEVLSPTKKLDPGRTVYLQKQQDYLAAGVNLLEIDLLRIGRPPFLEEYLHLLRPAHGTRYLVTATRALRPWRREIYYCPLRERLPAVRVPLRTTDPDVPLDLQPLIDRCYFTGRYWQGSHQEIPGPALPPDDDGWSRDCLLDAGLT